jgi:hypothetical protein
LHATLEKRLRKRFPKSLPVVRWAQFASNA